MKTNLYYHDLENQLEELQEVIAYPEELSLEEYMEGLDELNQWLLAHSKELQQLRDEETTKFLAWIKGSDGNAAP